MQDSGVRARRTILPRVCRAIWRITIGDTEASKSIGRLKESFSVRVLGHDVTQDESVGKLFPVVGSKAIESADKYLVLTYCNMSPRVVFGDTSSVYQVELNWIGTDQK